MIWIWFDSVSCTILEEVSPGGQLGISASVVSGSLDDEVQVLFSTQGGTAQCKIGSLSLCLPYMHIIRMNQ